VSKKTEHFGSFRVKLVVALYSRVVDLYNFAIVFVVLSAYEVGCIYCRVGILHFFNPLDLDNFYYLDLSYYDNRLATKVLLKQEITGIFEIVSAFSFWDNYCFVVGFFREYSTLSRSGVSSTRLQN
jgi:hypothetical protein